MSNLILDNIEEKQIKKCLADYKGDFLIKVGGHGEKISQNYRNYKHIYYVADHLINAAHEVPFILTNYKDLPFMTDSVNAIIIQHLLDFEQNPKRILKEIWRILAPEGIVILTGYNPRSLFGLTEPLKKLAETKSHNGTLLPMSKVKRLLASFGFEILKTKTFFFRPSSRNEKWQNRLAFVEIVGQFLWPTMGVVYYIVARKTTFNVTPLHVKERKKIVRIRGVTEPTS